MSSKISFHGCYDCVDCCVSEGVQFKEVAVVVNRHEVIDAVQLEKICTSLFSTQVEYVPHEIFYWFLQSLIAACIPGQNRDSHARLMLLSAP